MLGRGARGDLDRGVAHVDMDRGTGEQGNRETGEQGNRETGEQRGGGGHRKEGQYHARVGWGVYTAIAALHSLTHRGIHATVQAAAHCTQHYSPCCTYV